MSKERVHLDQLLDEICHETGLDWNRLIESIDEVTGPARDEVRRRRGSSPVVYLAITRRDITLAARLPLRAVIVTLGAITAVALAVAKLVLPYLMPP